MEPTELHTMIEQMVTNLKPYSVFNFRTARFIKEHERYKQAWDNFKEYHSHARSALLERFMV